MGARLVLINPHDYISLTIHYSTTAMLFLLPHPPRGTQVIDVLDSLNVAHEAASASPPSRIYVPTSFWLASTFIRLLS